jgi:hypothetical protein
MRVDAQNRTFFPLANVLTFAGDAPQLGSKQHSVDEYGQRAMVQTARLDFRRRPRNMFARQKRFELRSQFARKSAQCTWCVHARSRLFESRAARHAKMSTNESTIHFSFPLCAVVPLVACACARHWLRAACVTRARRSARFRSNRVGLFVCWELSWLAGLLPGTIRGLVRFANPW